MAGNAFPAPIYVNLYWDTNWDADHPTMPKSVIDAFTAAMTTSTFFSGLSEYGVESASFAGGFLPDPACPAKAPPRPGFYDPGAPSIAGFLNCELQHGVPSGPQVIYNIILPAGSVESDAILGSSHFCAGAGSATAWHFHETPYTPEAVLAIAGTIVTGQPGLLLAVLAQVADGKGRPVYTITSADPSCDALTLNLMHEMVEAASDPFPPTAVIASGIGEAVDFCDARNDVITTPFVPHLPSGLPAEPFTNPFDPNTMTGVGARSYWSNARQSCLIGFANSVTPVAADGTAPTVTMAGNGAGMSFTITGIGFGALPAAFPLAAGLLPYLSVEDNTQGWKAGNLLNNNPIRLNVTSWSDDTITIDGLDLASSKLSNVVMKPGDDMIFWVCNPGSGRCSVSRKPLVEPGNPQLEVRFANAPNVSTLFDVLIDGTVVAANSSGGSTGWRALGPGPHTVGMRATRPGFYKAIFSGACDANGRVVLAAGDSRLCTVVNLLSGGCSDGQHCCGVLSASGCSTGCVPNATACRPLCGPGTNKCCGAPSPDGRCDGTCIKSPPQSCER
ncbi:MAG TPA: hypothetical protein VGZ49_06720 [Xanthobacteraceae bacterium]|nr:hypothetical protein [Xanthobacteraceae bacterium]